MVLRFHLFKDLYKQFISLGPLVREKGLGAHGTHYECADYYDKLIARRPIKYNPCKPHRVLDRGASTADRGLGGVDVSHQLRRVRESKTVN